MLIEVNAEEVTIKFMSNAEEQASTFSNISKLFPTFEINNSIQIALVSCDIAKH